MPHALAVRPRLQGRLLVGAGLAIALTLAAIAPAQSASHREAPLIADDPAADNTDLYAFVAPDAPDSVTLISNFKGFQEAGGGPNYFEFGDDVRYSIHVDNSGDAVADVTYEFRFSTQTVNPDTYLYATGTIESIDDENWNRPQTYTVTRVSDGNREVIAEGVRTAPSNVGPRSTPNYQSLAQQAVHDLDNGGNVFAGQRDDGFYADIASIFDLGGLRPFNQDHAAPLPNEEGVDTFAGYNVQSIAMQIPKDELTGDGDVIGVWSTASRRKVSVYAGDSGASPVDRGKWVQVSRLGNPLVNEVVVPLQYKDAYNSIPAAADADVFPTLDAPDALGKGADDGSIPLVTDPILAGQIEELYGIDTPDAPRDDLVSVFLTGSEALGTAPEGEVRPAEMLRLDTSVDPASFDDQSRLGLLGGDSQGFPNGRRPGDDVIDISLRAVAGGYPLTPEFNESPNNALADGVDANDVDYLDTFPYLGTPHQGYDLNNPQRVPNNS